MEGKGSNPHRATPAYGAPDKGLKLATVSALPGREGPCDYILGAFPKLFNSFHRYILRTHYMGGPMHIKINKTSHHSSPFLQSRESNL